jgi:hypothetical protein
MTTSTSPVPWICGTVLLLGVLGGVFALAWHGTITGASVALILTPIVAAASTLLGIHVGSSATASALKGGS